MFFGLGCHVVTQRFSASEEKQIDISKRKKGKEKVTLRDVVTILRTFARKLVLSALEKNAVCIKNIISSSLLRSLLMTAGLSSRQFLKQ